MKIVKAELRAVCVLKATPLYLAINRYMWMYSLLNHDVSSVFLTKFFVSYLSLVLALTRKKYFKPYLNNCDL